VDREEIFYLVPYVLALAVSLGVFVYTWLHRHVRGAGIYTWFVGGQCLTVFAFILELVGRNLEVKLLWDKIQWLTDTYLVFIPFLLFSLQFSEFRLSRPRLTWGIWLGIPILFTLLLFTDSLHHLVYPNPHLSAASPFPELLYDYTFVVYGYSLIFIYGINIYGISLLIRRALQPHNVQRGQHLTVAAGFMIPITLSLFTLFDVYIFPQRDQAPFSFAIGNLVVAWGLFRYGLFDLVPIARDRVLENLTDAVAVVDMSNRVVDVNQAALSVIGKQRPELIGYPVHDAFDNWPGLIDRSLRSENAPLEFSANVKGERRTYELSVSTLRDRMDSPIGRIFLAHEITERKSLEDRYRLLSEELEHRVRERTEELSSSAERYRAVVENQTEFIVRWRPDGTRSFANEPYRRYFGLKEDEELEDSFMPLIVEEDRPAVEEKIARLLSGETSVETEVHRVIRPNGTIAWQEWTDQSIHDDKGRIVEFQSVGRDVTERKHAEEELRLSRNQLQDLSRRLVELHETEQRAIGRELHDQIGQMLTALKIILVVLPDLPADQVTRKMEQARELVDELLARVSQLTLDLRPPMLDDLGLMPALGWHIRNVRDQTGISVDFNHRGLEGRRFDPEVETTAYRIVQEALTNAARHSRANRASIRVYAGAGQLEIRIEDEGQGFDPELALAKNRGLRGMRERAKLLGGTLDVDSEIGRGARIRLVLPLPEESG
jgi:PAS domain S-box-containing protein